MNRQIIIECERQGEYREFNASNYPCYCPFCGQRYESTKNERLAVSNSESVSALRHPGKGQVKLIENQGGWSIDAPDGTRFHAYPSLSGTVNNKYIENAIAALS
jgi:hypothetical protein